MKCLLFILCLSTSFDEEPVFLEMEVPRSSYYVQEPIPLLLRIGYDARFFKDHAIQLFHRRLDVPVQLEAGWIDAAAYPYWRQVAIFFGAVVVGGQAKDATPAVVGRREEEQSVLGLPQRCGDVERVYG